MRRKKTTILSLLLSTSTKIPRTPEYRLARYSHKLKGKRKHPGSKASIRQRCHGNLQTRLKYRKLYRSRRKSPILKLFF